MIDIKDIKNAREQISDIINETPILSSKLLSEMSGNRLYLKGEHLQKTGSFKIRGATNRVKQAKAEKANYITTASSGNHGQAIAYITNKLHIPSTIVVPEDVNMSKWNAIKSYNGNIVTHGLLSTERIARAKEIAEFKKGVYASSFDDKYVMAGQGTIGLEILEQLDNVDVVVVPIGGGGLVSGILTAIKETKPSVKVIGVEPEIANDTYLSLQKNKIVSIPRTLTIADGLRTSEPGEMTLPIIQKYIDDLVLVSEEEIREALFLVLERMKQLIEPSSAVTVAAVMFDKLGVTDKNVVAVISGGNVNLTELGTFFAQSTNA